MHAFAGQVHLRCVDPVRNVEQRTGLRRRIEEFVDGSERPLDALECEHPFPDRVVLGLRKPQLPAVLAGQAIHR